MHLEDLAFEDPINVLDLRAQNLMLLQQIADGMRANGASTGGGSRRRCFLARIIHGGVGFWEVSGD